MTVPTECRRGCKAERVESGPRSWLVSSCPHSLARPLASHTESTSEGAGAQERVSAKGLCTAGPAQPS